MSFEHAQAADDNAPAASERVNFRASLRGLFHQALESLAAEGFIPL